MQIGSVRNAVTHGILKSIPDLFQEVHVHAVKKKLFFNLVLMIYFHCYHKQPLIFYRKIILIWIFCQFQFGMMFLLIGIAIYVITNGQHPLMDVLQKITLKIIGCVLVQYVQVLDEP